MAKFINQPRSQDFSSVYNGESLGKSMLIKNKIHLAYFDQPRVVTRLANLI